MLPARGDIRHRYVCGYAPFLTLEDLALLRCFSNMTMIVPADAEETRGRVTADEHHLTGGLGGAVAELLAVERPTRLRMVGMPDVFAAVGRTGPLRERYAMSAEAIAAACRTVLAIGPATR